MSARATERVLWGGAALCALIALVGWHLGAPPGAAPSSATINGAPQLVVWAGDSVSAATPSITTRDPFRLSRRPAMVPYVLTPPGTGSQSLPPTRPPLALVGLVGGPPWLAILDGVPGHAESMVARAGDTLARAPTVLVLRAVRRDTVVVRGVDTTWMLPVRHPWP